MADNNYLQCTRSHEVQMVSTQNHAKEYIAYIDQCTKGSWNNNFMQKFENTKITVFLNSKTQSHVIQSCYENLALIPIEGKSGFVSHTKLTAEATFMDLFLKSLSTMVVLKKLTLRGRHRRSRGNPISSSFSRHGARIRTKTHSRTEKTQNHGKTTSQHKKIQNKNYKMHEQSKCHDACHSAVQLSSN